MGNGIRNDDNNDLTGVWKNQPVERLEISLVEIRRKAQKLEKRILWRNLREYAASVLVIAAFGYYISVFHSALIRTGCGLVIAGTLFVVFALHKKGAARTIPAELALRTCVDFHRRELERQRDLLRTVWSWYLLPFVPGMIVFQIGLLERALAQPNASAHAGAIVASSAIPVVGGAVVFVGIAKLNHWAAGKLQREIDALDRVEKEP
jgi:hypothetical protein